MKAVLDQTIDFGNVIKITELIDIGSKYVETNIKLKNVKDYIPYLLEFNSNNLMSETMPGESIKENGVWVVMPSKTEISKIINKMFINI